MPLENKIQQNFKLESTITRIFRESKSVKRDWMEGKGGGVRAGLVNTHSVPRYWLNQPFSFQRLTNSIIDPTQLKGMLTLLDAPADSQLQF